MGFFCFFNKARYIKRLKRTLRKYKKTGFEFERVYLKVLFYYSFAYVLHHFVGTYNKVRIVFIRKVDSFPSLNTHFAQKILMIVFFPNGTWHI